MNGEKTAVVTGGATGIGAACVRELSGKGFRVGIHYRASAEAAGALLAQIGDGFLIPADLDRIDQIDAMVERIKGETERVDVLVNNAGIAVDADMQRMRIEQFDAQRATLRSASCASLCSAPAAAGSSISRASSAIRETRGRFPMRWRRRRWTP